MRHSTWLKLKQAQMAGISDLLTGQPQSDNFGAPPHSVMPGPTKKEQISDAVAKAMTGSSIPKSMGTKAGNKDWSSSSFYVPKRINLRFNNAINTLKAFGYDVDRSDLLSAFMDRFSQAVSTVEQSMDDSEEIDLAAVLKEATGGAAGDVEEVSNLKKRLQSTLKMADKYAQITNRDLEEKDRQISMLLELLPEDQRERLKESMAPSPLQ